MALLKKSDPNLASKLVETAGVYVFYDQDQTPIYIGKAINIRKRVDQHFTDRFSSKERLITQNTVFLEYFETNSEFEALVLEANLVKKHLPKYNAALRDDKSRLYIVITKETYPKIRLERKQHLNPKQFSYVFGPLNSGATGRMLLSKIRRIIPYCTEKHIGKRPCFYSQIGLCAPCPNVITSITHPEVKRQFTKSYRRNLGRIKALFEGNGRALLKEMQRDLQHLAKSLRYEEAAVLRDQINYLEQLFQKQLVYDERLEEANYIEELRDRENAALARAVGLDQLTRVECYDISNLNFKEATASMVVFVNGRADTDEYRRFRIKGFRRFDPEMLLEVVSRRLYHQDWPQPDLMVIDGGTPQLMKLLPELQRQFRQLPLIVGLAKRPDRLIIPFNGQFQTTDPGIDALHYLGRIRDEAHRFAKKYHLTLRRNELKKTLDQYR